MINLNINSKLVEKLKEKNILEATAVQKKVIPEILQGKNLVFQSDTGTGKTLAFLLPLIEKYNLDNSDKIVLIISPTHELASQIKNEAAFFQDIKAVLCFGGSPLKRQFEMLKEKPQFIVGSASRISELIMLKKIKTDKICACVFDEVDRLLSKELKDETGKILQLTDKLSDLQIIACSATIKKDTDQTLNSFIDNKKTFETVLLPQDDLLTSRIKHIAIYSESRNKADTLRSFIAAEKPEKALVFINRPQDVEILASKLRHKKINCESLHAKADKVQRKAAIDRFRSGKCNLLITSDLAARGLDIPNITHVIQMDLPKSQDFFIHRAGRTARCGKKGINVVIGDGYEMENYSKLEKKLEIIVFPCELHSGKLVFLN